MSDSDPFGAVPAPLRGAVERRGFTALTAVQAAVLARPDDEGDLRISSQTGSGKTWAVGFAVAPTLLDPSDGAEGPKVLVLAPTRELAQQVARELDSLYADLSGVEVEVVTGGADPGRERRALKRRPAVLVATPGRLLDHLRSGNTSLASVRHAILDEADQMLDMGFRDELDAILEQLPESRRLHMVSATFARAVLRFADRYQSNVRHLEGTRLGAANADIEHVAHLVLPGEKHGALINLLLVDEARGRGACLVFVRRRADTTELAELLVEDGFSAMPFSGDLSQGQRERTLAAFRRGLVRVLVATDVAARGIDVQDIATVVHYDLPPDVDTYTHRSGRTGRAGQKGRSAVLVPPSGERRARRLLEDAGVQVDWQPVPDAKRIEKAAVKRARRALDARLSVGQELATKHLEYAEGLLEKHDHATLVAILLDMARPPLPREAERIRELEPRGDGPPPRGRGRGRSSWGRARRAPDRRSSERKSGRPRGGPRRRSGPR